MSKWITCKNCMGLGYKNIHMSTASPPKCIVCQGLGHWVVVEITPTDFDVFAYRYKWAATIGNYHGDLNIGNYVNPTIN